MKKTVNKRLCFLLLLMVTTTLWAQKEPGTWTLYPRVGLTWSKHAGSKIYYDDGLSKSVSAKMKQGLTAGAEIQWQMARVYALSAGVFWAQQGTKFPSILDEWTDSEQVHWHETSECSFRTQVLNMPLMLHAYVAKGLSVGVGVQPSVFLQTRSITMFRQQAMKEASEITEQGAKETQNVEVKEIETDQKATVFRSASLSIPLAIAYEYENVQLSLRYNIGLTNISKMESGIHNHAMVFTIGYGIDL